MERETFVFYKDWLNVIRDLPSEVQLEVYQAIAEYAIYGNLIELKPLAKVAFGFVKQTIDRDTQKYISIKEKRKDITYNTASLFNNCSNRKFRIFSLFWFL